MNESPPTVTHVITSPVGPLRLTATEQALLGVYFLGEQTQDVTPVCPEQTIVSWATRELQAYFAGQLRTFTVPLQPVGTTFQLSVWQQLQAIPWGETCSYGDIARALGQPGASRAVGMANNRNPLPIIIPCHRVIGSAGQLVGFGGGLSIKQQLLALEQAQLGLL
ncbi:methylated-DNA--[protein]-cysteine S-methyltransferase [Pokkaliibacter sp. MBI-7]|uniref:methylated-DNA--[protein]-cysteine S-methyltransferase n=1 Tax=Pokkaliibacter sp. MBI-7 TaxID=3040600 RepID=UPI00244BAC24|nr:methylated-DNA--[protein]-cysteine S-methyltransferase [Pokkaliibacter sp. MBI-7]MDH2433276.1 methylated-DNA--[protein]-cysteine S-methyltransferase [Pokkaliibacter sp. MBI-7]